MTNGRRASNRQVKKEGGYYYPKAGSIRVVLGVTWSLALAVERSEMTLDEARQRYREARRQKEGPLHLIALREVAEMLELHPDEVNRLRNIGELPHAATIGSRTVWFREDVEAHGHRPVPDRTPSWMQSDVVDVAEAALRLKKKQNTLIAAISGDRWTAVPEPDGKAGDVWYWVRGTFEAWLQAHGYE
jgi:hypothetical protein